MKNAKGYHQSIAKELKSVKDRVRNLIRDAHWGEEGKYKEVILKNIIKRHLPEKYTIGSGFVVSGEDPIERSTQIDLIVYENSFPTLFKEGDFVILTPEGVKAVIEVKTSLKKKSDLIDPVEKQNDVGKQLFKWKQEDKNLFSNSIFFFQSASEKAIKKYFQEDLKENYIQNYKHQSGSCVKLICLGQNFFISRKGHSFRLFKTEGLAPAYYIHNLLSGIDYRSMTNSIWLRDPEENFLIDSFSLNDHLN